MATGIHIHICHTPVIGVECYHSVSPEWFLLPIGDGVAMQRVNVYQFYTLGHNVHALNRISAGQKIKEHYYQLLNAQAWLEFIEKDKLVPVGVAGPACHSLLNIIGRVLKPNSSVPGSTTPDLEKEISVSDAYTIERGIETFETVLSAQMQSLSTYFVSRKLGYETPLLIEEAENLLPESIREEIPEAIHDLQQAGKCIAFDIPTAAGFHLTRATEAVIRKYYAKVVGRSPKPKMRNWGTYVKNLHTAGADARITGFLDHIREAYRNPLLHPEDTLTPEDAQVLMGVCVSAIVAMVQAMNSLPVATSAIHAAKAAGNP